MKFPKKLSKERLSLLSPEDRKIYEYEHSGLCPEMKKLYESEEVDDEELTFEEVRDFELDNEYTEEEKREIKRIFDEMLFESLFDELYDKELIEEVGLDEYNNIKKQIFEYIMNDPELNALNEAEGRAADWWMDCSWIIKLSAGLLTGLLGIIAWLIMKGKDRLAMAKLKQYMNKLVELTDQGLNKKRPWYSFLMPSRKNKQNTGDYNKACFRTIQETAERNMAGLYALALYLLGFLPHDTGGFNEIHSGYVPQQGSGLYALNNAITDSYNDDTLLNIEAVKKILPTTFEKEITGFLNNIELTGVPTNFGMLMCNIEYPTKANENPNGSLYMLPTKEILDDAGSDIGYRFFSNLDMTNIIHTKRSANEFYSFNSRNSMLRSLFEVEDEETHLDKTKDKVDDGGFGQHGLSPMLTPDIDPTAVAGKELSQETKKREKTRIIETGNLKNPIDAIDNYVKNSLPIISDLIRTVCGSESSNAIKELSKSIINLISASNGNLGKWIKSKESVIHEIAGIDLEKRVAILENHLHVTEDITNMKVWVASGYLDLFLNTPAKKAEFIDWSTEVFKDPKYGKSDLEHDIKLKFNGSSYNDLLAIAKKKGWLKENASQSYLVDYNIRMSLFEDELFKTADEFVEELTKKCDNIKTEILNMILPSITDALASDPKDWEIIKDSKDRMTKLKEAADKEITAKIELICRTASGGNLDISDKFKAALSKHPVRAESLKNIWARYSDDLTDRINVRLRSIYHGLGNSSIYVVLRQFLLTTYPNLISHLIYLRLVLFLLENYTKIQPIEMSTAEEINQKHQQLEFTYLKNCLLDIEILNQATAPQN